MPAIKLSTVLDILRDASTLSDSLDCDAQWAVDVVALSNDLNGLSSLLEEDARKTGKATDSILMVIF